MPAPGLGPSLRPGLHGQAERGSAPVDGCGVDATQRQHATCLPLGATAMAPPGGASNLERRRHADRRPGTRARPRNGRKLFFGLGVRTRFAGPSTCPRYTDGQSVHGRTGVPREQGRLFFLLCTKRWAPACLGISEAAEDWLLLPQVEPRHPSSTGRACCDLSHFTKRQQGAAS
jgi:hypothetical protein